MCIRDSLPPLHRPTAFEVLDLFRVLDPNAHIVFAPQAIAQQFPKTGEIRFLQVQGRGEIKILAIADSAITQTQACSSLEREAVEPSRFIERTDDVVMNELFLYNREQRLHFASTGNVFSELLEINRHLPLPPNR